MEIQYELLFFFSALGAFNGLLMGMYFLFSIRPVHPSHYFLGALLLTLSVRVGKSVFFYFHADLADVYIQIGLFACWFIGPFLYFYLKAALALKDKFRKEVILHFSLLVPVGIGLFMAFPRSEYESLWGKVLIYLIYGQWFLYVVGAVSIFLKNREVLSGEKSRSFRLWLLSILGGNAMICLAFISGNYTSYIAGALCFSFLFYLLILLLLFTKQRNQLLLLYPPKYGQRTIPPALEATLSTSLNQLMEEDKAFKDPKLTLPILAKRINVLPSQLSQYVNEHLQTTFRDYVNAYRIEEAMRMMRAGSPYSLEAIGYDCGFNSKSTFYAAFKKHSGTTPMKFKESLPSA
ncbi:MAG: helix-turn-helix domain-containing protein [Bacteroidota bacterium]